MDGATGNVFAPSTPPLDFTVFGHAGIVGGGAVGVAGMGVGSVGMGMVVRIGEATDGGGVGSTGVGTGLRRRHASARS